MVGWSLLAWAGGCMALHAPFPTVPARLLWAGLGDAAWEAGADTPLYFLLTIGSFLHPPKQTLQCF